MVTDHELNTLIRQAGRLTTMARRRELTPTIRAAATKAMAALAALGGLEASGMLNEPQLEFLVDELRQSRSAMLAGMAEEN